ncbi:MAG: hypothetical protein HQM13_16280 [SAR324 cluster bacterium]|nr:hypothetical protein [SAR324 cluster bacterium]
MQKFLIKCLLSCLAVFIGMESSGSASEYSTFFLPGSTLVYRHWNLKKNKITGYSRLSYRRVMEPGNEFLVETHEDSKPNGKVFLRKKLWFELKTGQPVRYFQEDLRKNWSIENHYKLDAVKSKLSKNGKMIEIDQPLEKNTVPFELLTFYLRRQYAEHQFARDQKFLLYLPATKFESEMLSATWDFSAVKEKELELETPFGMVSAAQILVTTTSDFLKWLLPQSKTNFRFFIEQQMPHHILAFEEHETRFILENLENGSDTP